MLRLSTAGLLHLQRACDDAQWSLTAQHHLPAVTSARLSVRMVWIVALVAVRTLLGPESRTFVCPRAHLTRLQHLHVPSSSPSHPARWAWLAAVLTCSEFRCNQVRLYQHCLLMLTLRSNGFCEPSRGIAAVSASGLTCTKHSGDHSSRIWM